MAYRSSFNYRGGNKKVRVEKKARRVFGIVGWIILWLIVGMILMHLIFSVISSVRKGRAELSSSGIAPILSIPDETNQTERTLLYYDGDLSDHAATDRFIAFMKERNISEVLLDIKPESGLLAYQSNVKTAALCAAVPEGAPKLDEVLIKFSNADMKVTARVSLFRDDAYAIRYPALAAKTAAAAPVQGDNPETQTAPVATQTLWLDENGGAWVSPFDSGITGYAAEIIGELSSYGITEVLIDNIRFPTVYDGADYKNAVFADEQDAANTRAGCIRSAVSQLHAAAQSGGMRMLTAIDGVFACGVQDEAAGMTFNIFELETDVLCPVFMPAQFAENGIMKIGDTSLENPNAQPYETVTAALKDAKLMQGALGSPPVMMPVIQAYSPAYLPKTMRVEYTAEHLAAQQKALLDAAVHSRIIYGTQSAYADILPTPGE